MPELTVSSIFAHDPTMSLDAADETATDRVGAALASVLKRGDVLAVSGPLGAGKSHLCRAIVRALLGDAEAEVPSPSYTLVNVYRAGDVEVWHADLYRIADAGELTELGLDDACADAIVLIEWPERWTALPPRRMDLAISVGPGERRTLAFTAVGRGWDHALAALEALQ
jgi:tRNA threonylcarbamoyl adenosine modification protein YjeE